ncbi:HDL300Wp [Eremothecium sinecaudum]|uniref:Pre-mRNA polyadenylation factor FIP1 n=1 Tax=Eremothecium sinecaudum TaxID=45286 RepID=A0A0X8HS34_9SACH|nr:HDL300Wp [Eremothecium sinecaudum]AMD20444.1 HDL300Wp [Eremothecium sinecaudum]
MVSSEDEDDRFLYGSDAEADSSSQHKRKLEPQTTVQVSEEREPKRVKIPTTEPAADDEEIIEEDVDSSDSEADADDSDKDSDSDVEIIIGTGTDLSKLDSKNAATPSTAATTTSASELTIAPVSEQTGSTTTVATVNDNSSSVTKAVGAIDINAIGEFEGQPITDIDPEVLKEKPWRQPGANLSDYFNYGFTEETWMEYLHKQEKLRKEYNPQKILMGLLALQQQGKLNDTTGAGDGGMAGAGSNGNGGVASHGDVNSPNKNNASVNAMPPPPAFPMGMHHMFGGFPPFPFPGMMPPNLGANAGNANKNGSTANASGNNNGNGK